VVLYRSGIPPIRSDFSYYYGSSGQVFFNSQSPGAVSWSWDFGDGTTSVERNPTHEYTQSGTYMVSLTVIDLYGAKIVLTKKVTIQRPIVEDLFAPSSIALMGFFTIGIIGYLYYDSKMTFLITAMSWGAFAVLLMLLIL
jgi:hypothetical protein